VLVEYRKGADAAADGIKFSTTGTVTSQKLEKAK
jgi:hypothetical protein